jgi:hypothetical protein
MSNLAGLLAAIGGAVLTIIGVLPGLHSGAEWWMLCFAIIGSCLIVIGLIYQFREYLSNRFGDKAVLLADHHSVLSADDDDAKWVYDRARREFGEDITPLNQINAIRARYSDAFKVIWWNTRLGKERRGYICAFPIDKKCVSEIKAGTFSILRLNPLNIPESIDKASAFYVGGILADDRRAGVFLLNELRKMMPIFKVTTDKIIFTRPITPAGMRYVQRNDFSEVVNSKSQLGDFFFVQL